MARPCYHGDSDLSRGKYIGCPGKPDDVHVIPEGQRAVLCNPDSMNWPTAPKFVTSGGTCSSCRKIEAQGNMMQKVQKARKFR